MKLMTRQLYRFEGDTSAWPTEFTEKRPVSELRQWVHAHWSYYRIRATPFDSPPDVSAVKGLLHNGRERMSWYDSNNHLIGFAPSQRNLITAVHEIVHSLGKDYHDKDYVDLYFKVLDNCGLPFYWCSEMREKYRLI